VNHLGPTKASSVCIYIQIYIFTDCIRLYCTACEFYSPERMAPFGPEEVLPACEATVRPPDGQLQGLWNRNFVYASGEVQLRR